MKKIMFFISLSIFMHSFIFLELDLSLYKNEQVHFSKNNSSKVSIKIRVSSEEQTIENELSQGDRPSKTKKNKSKKKKLSELRSKSLKKVDQGGSDELSRYLDQIRKTILRTRTKSRLAQRLRLKGMVELNFLIKKPGSITDIQIKKSSGNSILDNSAVVSVKNIKEIPIIPSVITMKEIPVSIEILYE